MHRLTNTSLPKPPIGAGGCDHRDECQTGDYHAGVALLWRRGNRRLRPAAPHAPRGVPWRWSVCHVPVPGMRTP